MKRARGVLAGATGSYVAVMVGALIVSRGHQEFMASAFLSGWLAVVALVGAVIALRRPRHAIGWLMIALALVIQLGFFTKDYAHLALIRQPGNWPWGDAAAWGSLWITIPGFALLAFLLLVFPTGRLPSSRWRWPVRAFVAAIGFSAVSVAIRPGPVDGLPGVDNPMGIEGAGVLFAISDLLEPLAGLFFLGIVVSLFVRARRSEGVERQQMKWVAFAAALLPIAFGVGQILDAAFPTENSIVLFFANVIGLTGIPIAIGVAILRYRLYDIDVVINRTLVYGLLTAILGAGYLGLVALMQLVLQPLTPQSELSVVVSTLAIAALFRPLRARLQTFIDRRFYRHKYDAAATLDGFSARLRDQVDLESLRREVVAVVGTTMQPAHASLWLRTSGDRK